jgi:hypothetical protein
LFLVVVHHVVNEFLLISTIQFHEKSVHVTFASFELVHEMLWICALENAHPLFWIMEVEAPIYPLLDWTIVCHAFVNDSSN